MRVRKAKTAGAELSPCGRYRYRLWRHWDWSLPAVVWVMLNPSTADATKDDPTLRKCVALSLSWGYGGLVLVNLFALRSPNPNLLLTSPDPVGPWNDSHIRAACTGADLIIAAWGNWGSTHGRDRKVRGMLREDSTKLHYLTMTGEGQPGHPLYLPLEVQPILWENA